jgi:hypothetical protein
VAAAVVASAGPLITTPGRQAAWARRTARAIVVDRGLPEAARGAVDAVTSAERSTATVAETFPADPLDASVPLALAWLSRQAPARREIVFVGDGASLPGPAAVAAIPAATGIRVRTVEVGRFPIDRHWIGSDANGRLRGLRLDGTAAGTEAGRPASEEAPPPLPVSVHASAGDQRVLDAVWEGVRADGAFLRPAPTWLALEVEWTTAAAAPDGGITALTAADRAALWPMAMALAAGEPSAANTPPWTTLAPAVAAARRADAIAIRVTQPVEPAHAAAVLRAALQVAAGEAELPRRARETDERSRRTIERPAGDVPREASRFEAARDTRWTWAAVLLAMVAEHVLRRRRDARSVEASVDAATEAAS